MKKCMTPWERVARNIAIFEDVLTSGESFQEVGRRWEMTRSPTIRIYHSIARNVIGDVISASIASPVLPRTESMRLFEKYKTSTDPRWLHYMAWLNV
jgi:hypothetical protein